MNRTQANKYAISAGFAAAVTALIPSYFAAYAIIRVKIFERYTSMEEYLFIAITFGFPLLLATSVIIFARRFLFSMLDTESH